MEQKNRKNRWKRLLSLVLTLAMVAGCFSGMELKTNAATVGGLDSEYTELTFNDFGIGDKEIAAGSNVSGSLPDGITSWDKVAVTGYVTFSDVASFSGDSIQIGGKFSFGPSSDEQFSAWDNDKDTTGGWSAFPKTNGVKIRGEKIKIRVEVKATAVALYVNDVYLQDCPMTVGTSSMNTSLTVSAGAGSVSVESIGSEYKELTFSDFGIGDKEIAAGSNASGSLPDGITSWDKVAITGYVTFSDVASFSGDSIQIGGKFSFGPSSDEQFGAWDNDKDSTGGWSAFPKTNGVKIRGEKIKIRVEVKATAVALYVNDVYLQDCPMTVGTSSMNTSLTVSAGAGSVSVESIPTTYTTINFETYGLNDTEVSGGESGKQVDAKAYDAPSMSGIAFEDKVAFQTGEPWLYIATKAGNGWHGIRVYQNGSSLVFLNVVDGSAHGNIAVLSNSDCGIATATDEIRLKVGFSYVGATDVLMRICVNEKYNKTVFVEGISQEIGTGMMVYAKAGASIALAKKEALPYEQYTQITPLDFGYTDADYTAGTHGTAETPHTQKPLKEDGSVADLHEKYLEMDVAFEDTTSEAYLVYASEDGWNGIRIKAYDNKLYFFANSSEVGSCTFEEAGITNGKTFTLKLYTKVESENVVLRAVITSDAKTKQIDDMAFNKSALSSGVSFGNKLAVYTPSKSGTIRIESPVLSTEEKGSVSYNLDDGNYLVIEKDVTIKKNGETTALTLGSEISEPGNYTIESKKDGVLSQKKVILYKLGDVNLDGVAANDADVAALEALLSQGINAAAATAEQLGADLDNDNKVGTSDLKLLKEIVAGTKTLDDVKEMYYVPAMTYDYIGGDEVMPIVGYYGPYNRNSQDFTTNDIMQAIKDSGVNLVNYSHNSWGETSDNAEILSVLSQMEKYHIGYFVEDWNLNAKVTQSGSYDPISENPTAAEIAGQMSNYGQYESVLGSHVVDEPKITELENYTTIAKKLNQYVNTNAFINLCPEDTTEEYQGTEGYDTYWNTYIEGAAPKLLSVDDYPFNDSAKEGVTNATGYFTSLSTIREKALEKGVPFWFYVQAGGSFKQQTGTFTAKTDNDLIATEQETYWNVNTALAYGAKGIEWFPLLQNEDFATNKSTLGKVTYDYERNGLIGADVLEVGIAEAKTPAYTYAVNINKQIAAVDEVLMKANSKGVIATEGHAKTQTTEATAKANIEAKDTTYLSGVSTDDATYGALIGCFDYKGTEAYYVVNYNVTADTNQTITLTFDKERGYYTLDASGKTEGTGSTCELTIDAGKAVLVVVDNQCKHTDKELVAEDKATCTKDGKKAHYKCKNCDTLFDAADQTTEITESALKIDALGHDTEAVEGKTVTCTENGTKAHYKCKNENCSALFEDKEATKPTSEDKLKIEATGHNMSSLIVKAPTCTEDGTKAHYHCEKCNKDFEDNAKNTTNVMTDTVDPATGHKYNNQEWEKSITHHWYKMTCECSKKTAEEREAIAKEKSEKSGYTEHIDENTDNICDACGAAMHTHQMEHISAKPSSCVEAGNNEYYYCSDCKKCYKDKAGTTETTIAAETLPLGEHKFTEKEATEKHICEEATCTEAAIYYVSCKSCKKNGTETFTSGEAKGHSYQKKVAAKYLKTPANCEKAAVYYKSCKDCGANGTETFTYGTKKGHTYKTVVKKAATTTQNGQTVERCSSCKTEKNKKTIYKASKVSLKTTALSYTGIAQKPTLIVKDSKGKTISSKCYDVTWEKGRKNVGTYKVTVKFKGNYSGSKALSFKINPKKISIQTSAAKKAFNVKWTKQSKSLVDGYQVWYSTNNNFKKSVTKKTVKNTGKTVSYKASKLKKNTKYYVKVRSYKKIGKTTYYSDWSSVKRVTTKK